MLIWMHRGSRYQVIDLKALPWLLVDCIFATCFPLHPCVCPHGIHDSNDWRTAMVLSLNPRYLKIVLPCRLSDSRQTIPFREHNLTRSALDTPT